MSAEDFAIFEKTGSRCSRTLLPPATFLSCPQLRNSVSIVMRWCRSVTNSARRFCRQALTWRTARALCAVWFTLTSIGFPGSLSVMSGKSCARNPGSQCGCSLAKRISGSCCCGREAPQQVAKSCCSPKKSALQLNEPTTSCCSSKSKPQRIAAAPPKVELSIAKCDCNSDSPETVSLAQEPRLPVAVTAILFEEANTAFVALPVDRTESALLLPPVPPPKIVL